MLFCSIYALSFSVSAQELLRFEAGLRPDINLGRGKPANDMPAFSLLSRLRINNDWLVGMALEYAPGFDVERPYRLVGLESNMELDADATSTMLSLWAERRYHERELDVYWFWTVGVGLNKVDIDDLQGLTNVSTNYNIRVDAETEKLITLTGGRRHSLGGRWAIGYGARIEQRFTKWRIVDRVSGRSGVIDDYIVKGIFVDINYRF
jgi:hypothetical protein